MSDTITIGGREFRVGATYRGKGSKPRTRKLLESDGRLVCYEAQGGAVSEPQAPPRPSFWRMLIDTPRIVWGLMHEPAAVIDQLNAENRSLRASLDDAHAREQRLTAEKHARDVALRRVIEAAESLHAQGERG